VGSRDTGDGIATASWSTDPTTIEYGSSLDCSGASSSSTRNGGTRLTFSGSGAATANLSRGIDVNVMYVLLSLDGLPCGLAEHGPQFGGRLLPLGAAESFRGER